MTLGVMTETHPGERRVALVPVDVAKLRKKDITVVLEKGAGVRAGYLDAAYEEQGAKLLASRDAVFSEAQWIAQVRGPGANEGPADADVAKQPNEHALLAFLTPLGSPQAIQR